jgi:hypothetical protein
MGESLQGVKDAKTLTDKHLAGNATLLKWS